MNHYLESTLDAWSLFCCSAFKEYLIKYFHFYVCLVYVLLQGKTLSSYNFFLHLNLGTDAFMYTYACLNSLEFLCLAIVKVAINLPKQLHVKETTCYQWHVQKNNQRSNQIRDQISNPVLVEEATTVHLKTYYFWAKLLLNKDYKYQRLAIYRYFSQKHSDVRIFIRCHLFK